MSKDSSYNNRLDDSSSSTEAPAGQKDSLRSFIGTLASFSGDLSSLTCPSFLLSSVSLLEYRQVFNYVWRLRLLFLQTGIFLPL